ncbi:hypothetical protein I7I50_06075 [Histoplasma capsulatum G186AR]|uniref:Uncharacterized protein n=1 Tax=Ajellomyces capsulatus TaxID=5037 RepID=A0A8H7YYM2_AJECA|nr:hypothetical protein I7I52_08813 [Histoplasma capsulatum]QSS67091.1 hypothetical protein I7I50_06075 [Histoplasma capsulatum G186AR]
MGHYFTFQALTNIIALFAGTGQVEIVHINIAFTTSSIARIPPCFLPRLSSFFQLSSLLLIPLILCIKPSLLHVSYIQFVQTFSNGHLPDSIICALRGAKRIPTCPINNM